MSDAKKRRISKDPSESTYKLTYFNGRGYAEVIRYIFTVAGQKYEDKRVSEEEWFQMKQDTPFHQIPILEVDGTVLYQTKAIARFLARRFNLMGETEFDHARVDMVMYCVDDMVALQVQNYGAEGDKRKEFEELYTGKKLPSYLGRLEKILKENNDGDGYFVGNSMTLADLYFAQVITWAEPNKIEVKWDDVPKLKALKERVENHPKIAEWINNRPKTDY